jgi:hypothetical protein
MYSARRVKFKKSTIVFPQFTNFPKATDILLTEDAFVSYLESILFAVAKKDLSFSCLYNFSNVMDNFLEFDFTSSRARISNELIMNTNMCKDSVNMIVVPIKITMIASKSKYDEFDIDTIMNISTEDDFTQFGFETKEERDVGDYLTGHSNVVIIDNKSKRLEFFEPHGASFGHHFNNIVNIQALFEKVIKLAFPFTRDYVFSNVAVSCPLGPQSLQTPSAGHCLAWSLLFVLLRILNSGASEPNISSTLYDFLIHIEGRSLDTLIRRFISFVKSLPKVEKPYSNSLEIITTRLLQPSDFTKIDQRLHYLLNIYFNKLNNLSHDDIDVVYEEINAYRHIPSFHKTYRKVFTDFVQKQTIDNLTIGSLNN